MRPRRRKSPWARKPTQQPCCSSSVPSALLSFVQQRLPVTRVAVTEATHSNGGYRLFLTTLETLNGVFFNLKTLRTPLPTGYPSAKNTPLPSLSSSLASIGDGSPTRAESLLRIKATRFWFLSFSTLTELFIPSIPEPLNALNATSVYIFVQPTRPFLPKNHMPYLLRHVANTPCFLPLLLVLPTSDSVTPILAGSAEGNIRNVLSLCQCPLARFSLCRERIFQFLQ